jgi:hypothetical protein
MGHERKKKEMNKKKKGREKTHAGGALTWA